MQSCSHNSYRFTASFVRFIKAYSEGNGHDQATQGIGRIAGGRKLVGPELLEVRAAPGGMLGGMMLGAVWFGSEDEDDSDRTMRSGSYDPLWGLGYAAYLSHQAFEASASAARPELHLSQFSVGFTTRLPEGRGPGSPSPAQLEAADGIARDMIIHSVDTLSRGSVDRFDWIDDLSIFEDLVTAIASQDMKVMRAGFVPWGVNPSSSGQSGFTSGSVAWGSSSGATVGGATSDDSGGITARPHGEIQPLRLSPPLYGNANVPGDSQTIDPQLVAMSGGSGGSGGAEDDYFAGVHDEGMTVADNGVLWNDNWGSEPGVVSLVTSPSHDPSFSLSSSGGFTYTPPENWAGNDSFTYTVTNSAGTSPPATATIAITNNAPVAGLDTYAAITNTELVIPSDRWPEVVGVFDNDADADGDPFTLSWNSQPQHGTVTIAADGSFVYMPETDYQGEDYFTYAIHDAMDMSEEQFVNINVYRFVVDLDTDSDNNGVTEGTLAEDNVEVVFPGKIIERNSDDDNLNLIRDFEEDPMTMLGVPFPELDLYNLEVAVETAIPQTNGFTFQFNIFNNKLRLWRDIYKQEEVTNQDVFTIGTDVIPNDLYVEGISVGGGTITGTLRNTAGAIVNEDPVLFTVVEMDIDTDSNNNGTVESGSVTEDLIENRPGSGPGEVGARIFANRDDDNENGKVDQDDGNGVYTNGTTDESDDFVDNDFAKITLQALGVDVLFEGYSLWLGVDSGLKVWGDEKKQLLSDHATPPFDSINRPEDSDYVKTNDTWYGWTIGDGPAGDYHPSELFIEGLGLPGLDSHCENVQWLLMKPGVTHTNLLSSSVLARDIVEINVEKIVWPFTTQPHSNWNNLPTSDWVGVNVKEAWYIDKSLRDYISAPNDKGHLETIHPDMDGGKRASEDGVDSPSTNIYGTNVTLKFDYEFERRGGNTFGYVQADLQLAQSDENDDKRVDPGSATATDRVNLGFVSNSGVKFSGEEVTILDVDKMIELAGGIDSFEEDDTAPRGPKGIDDSGNVDIMRTVFGHVHDFEDAHLSQLMSGVLYDGTYTMMDDFEPSSVASAVSADYIDALESNAARQSMANTMEVVFAGNQLTVSINDKPFYSADAGLSLGQFVVQSHWGSGVVFSNMDVTANEE